MNTQHKYCFARSISIAVQGQVTLKTDVNFSLLWIQSLYIPFYHVFSFCLFSLFCVVSLGIGGESTTGDNVRGIHGSSDSSHSPPFPVVEYIRRYGDRIDGQQFFAMRFADNVRENFGC